MLSVRPAPTLCNIASVAVSKVQPERAIVPEHAPDLAEHLHHVRDVLFGGRLQTELPFASVVAQAPVRRRGHTHLSRAVRQGSEHGQRITVVKRYAVHGSLPV